MNILIYVNSLDGGGAERVAALWAKGLFENHHNVSIAVNYINSISHYEVPDGVRIYRPFAVYDSLQKIFPCLLWDQIFSRIYNFVSEKVKRHLLGKILSKVNPEIIIVVLPELYDRIRTAQNICNKKILTIVTDHNSYERPDNAPFSPLQLELKFKKCYEYDYLTVLTKVDQSILLKTMKKSFMNKVSVLPNPLSYEPSNDVPPKEKIVLAVGRLNVWFCKGFDLLLKVWAKISKDFPDWKLEIAGNGDKTFLLKICEKLNITNSVVFLGYVNVKEYYEKASIFVMSSRYEGFGMALTEAMSQGCACVACDYNGRQREIIENESQGLICNPDDESSIESALRRVLSDEGYRFYIQKNAIERSKYYGLSNIMNCWNGIFKKIGLV